jgi:hypothetical protein
LQQAIVPVIKTRGKGHREKKKDPGKKTRALAGAAAAPGGNGHSAAAPGTVALALAAVLFMMSLVTAQSVAGVRRPFRSGLIWLRHL